MPKDVSVVFDLDGTLVDSAADLHAAAAALLGEEARAPLTLAQIRSFIGNGVPALVGRVADARGLAESDLPRLTTRFLQLYSEAPARLTRPMPGATEAVEELAASGARIGVCTNKPADISSSILEALGFARSVSVVIGGDTLAHRKPHPAPLLEALHRLGGRPGLFVGDSRIDAAAAAAADVPFVLFEGGYDDDGEIEARAAFQSYGDLPAIVADIAEDLSKRAKDLHPAG